MPDDILQLVTKREKATLAASQRAVILQPGALGDCILTLPLAEFLKNFLNAAAVDFLGRSEYISFFPSRTAVDGIRSMDSVDIFRFFADTNNFDLADGDALVDIFSDYQWIISFMGDTKGNFEQNLIFTVNCSRNSEVITLATKPPKDYKGHISSFYIEQLLEHRSGTATGFDFSKKTLIQPMRADMESARKRLGEMSIDGKRRIAVIAPGSGGLHKCWGMENFVYVGEVFKESGFEVVFLLGPAELERGNFEPEGFGVLSEPRLSDVAGLAGIAELYIGNDSGISHLFGAAGAKTIAIFGPTEERIYRPLGPKSMVFRAKDNFGVWSLQTCEDLLETIDPEL
ncbi:MAG: glycosyltransferase family 9 protein [Phycisphaerae bacterium]|nr:glycosyltransferase family 9 protein [Phycisphaerae bacterium]